MEKFTYDEIIKRDKTHLDITWIKDESLTDLENLPEPDELAQDIIENLEEALDIFKTLKVQEMLNEILKNIRKPFLAKIN